MDDLELGRVKKLHKKELKKTNNVRLLVPKKIKIDPSSLQNGFSTMQFLGIIGGIFLAVSILIYATVFTSIFVYQYYNTYTPFFDTTLPEIQASISSTNEDIIQIRNDLIILSDALNITLSDNDTFILSSFIYDQTQNKTQEEINIAVQAVLNALAANYAAQQIVLNGLNNNISTIFVDFLNQQLQLNTALNNISFLITQNNVLQITVNGLTFNVSNLIASSFLQQAINAGFDNNITTIFATLANQFVINAGFNNNITSLFVSLANQLIINNGYNNNFTSVFTSLANQLILNAGFSNNFTSLFASVTNQLIINAGVNNNFTTIFNFIVSQQLLNAGYDTLQAQINNITMAVANNFTLSSNVYDVPRGKNQQLINDDLYATQAQVNNGNISSAAIFDYNLGSSQNTLNALFNAGIQPTFTNRDYSMFLSSSGGQYTYQTSGGNLDQPISTLGFSLADSNSYDPLGMLYVNGGFPRVGVTYVGGPSSRRIRVEFAASFVNTPGSDNDNNADYVFSVSNNINGNRYAVSHTNGQAMTNGARMVLSGFNEFTFDISTSPSFQLLISITGSDDASHSRQLDRITMKLYILQQ